MKEFTNYRQFNKCCRKYWKRHATKSIFTCKGKKYVSYWTDKEFCFYKLTNPQDILSPNAYDKYRFYYDVHGSMFNDEREKWCSLIGKKVNAVYNTSSFTGIFEGFVITNNSIHYLMSDDSGEYMVNLTHELNLVE